MTSTVERFTTHISMVAMTIILASCGTSDPTDPDRGGVAVTRADLRPDSLAGWMYYAFDGDSIVPVDSAETPRWDIKIPFLTINSRTVDLMLNSGTVGKGATRGTIVSSRWENVTAVDAGWMFDLDDTVAANRVIPNCVRCPLAMFIYTGPPNHAITPSPDKVVIIRTAKGSIVKFQITSIYQHAVSNPTTTTPIGYYHFRYVKAVNGSF